jgi:hypothetical protein
MLALVGLVGALALPAVHWRLIGWWRGEPFYRGRPTSFWRAEVEASGVMLPTDAKSGVDLEFVRTAGAAERTIDSVCVLIGLGGRDGLEPPVPAGDADPLPLLLELLRDPNPRTRIFACQAISRLGEAARPAVRALQTLTGDQAAFAGMTVGHAAQEALHRIDPDAWEAAGRP